MAKGRILALTSNFPRWNGDSTTPFVLHLCQNLQKLGWHVDVLAPHAPGAAKVEVIGGVRVFRFQYLWPVSWQTVCYQGGAMGNLRKNRLNYLKLPLLLLSEWLALRRHLSSGKYNLLHSHWILPQGFIGRLVVAKLGIPHILTVHGGDIFGLRGEFLDRAKRFAIMGTDAVTVNSSLTEKAVHELLPALPIERIPMGVNFVENNMLDKVHELRRLYKKNDGPLLIFVGRIVEEKGVADLLAATRILLGDSCNVSVVIVGEGQDRPAMEQLAVDFGVDDNVSFIGWQPSEFIPSYLAAADIFVGPSRTASNGWVEAQGLTFVEAMMAGTVVIASRVGGIIDAVIHEQTGLLVDECNPVQIAQAVRRISGDFNLAERLRAGGRAMAERNFSGEASARAFDALCSRVTGW